MNTRYVDFAFCPCGEQTAIQPTKPMTPDTNPQSLESVEGSIIVACTKCKRVYRFDIGYMLSLPTPRGVAPYVPEAPTCVFRVPILCEKADCLARPVIVVEMSANTTAEQLQEEKTKWSPIGVLWCNHGHDIPWPQ